jgi:hypothetical protein
VENALFPLFVYRYNIRKSAEWIFVGIYYATFVIINLIYLINILLCTRERMRIKKASLMAERVRRQTAQKLHGSAKSHEIENVVQEVLVEHGRLFKLFPFLSSLPSFLPSSSLFSLIDFRYRESCTFFTSTSEDESLEIFFNEKIQQSLQ